MLATRKSGRHTVATKNNDPIVKALFEHIDSCGYIYGEIEERAGVARGRLYKWKRGISSPTHILLSCVAETVGLTLTLTPMQPAQELDRSQMELAL